MSHVTRHSSAHPKKAARFPFHDRTHTCTDQTLDDCLHPEREKSEHNTVIMLGAKQPCVDGLAKGDLRLKGGGCDDALGFSGSAGNMLQL
jgi:hypothetical protein